MLKVDSGNSYPVFKDITENERSHIRIAIHTRSEPEPQNDLRTAVYTEIQNQTLRFCTVWFGFGAQARIPTQLAKSSQSQELHFTRIGFSALITSRELIVLVKMCFIILLGLIIRLVLIPHFQSSMIYRKESIFSVEFSYLKSNCCDQVSFVKFV